MNDARKPTDSGPEESKVVDFRTALHLAIQNKQTLDEIEQIQNGFRCPMTGVVLQVHRTEQRRVFHTYGS